MTRETLKHWLDYDSVTGVFRWRRKAGHMLAGEKAGTIYSNGRRHIIVAGERHFAHRLAWLYVHGVWPSDQLDHINRDRDDNRIANLREATNQQNSVNRLVLKNNRLGVKGVGISTIRKRKAQRFRARIRVNDRLIHLGYFSTPEAASAAYQAAAVRYFGEFARTA